MSALTSKRQGRDGARTRRRKRLGTGGDCRAGRHDVVDQHDPPRADRRAVRRPDHERVADVDRSIRPAKSMLRAGSLGPLEGRDHRQPERSTDHSREKLRLVVATLPSSISVDGHVDEDVAADPTSSPALGHNCGQRLREALLRPVLDGVDRSACLTRERRAPFELYQTRRHGRRKPDRYAGRFVQSSLDRCPTAVAESNALAAAARAFRRQEQVEERLHAGSVAPRSSRGLNRSALLRAAALAGRLEPDDVALAHRRCRESAGG